MEKFERADERAARAPIDGARKAEVSRYCDESAMAVTNSVKGRSEVSWLSMVREVEVDGVCDGSWQYGSSTSAVRILMVTVEGHV